MKWDKKYMNINNVFNQYLEVRRRPYRTSYFGLWYRRLKPPATTRSSYGAWLNLDLIITKNMRKRITERNIEEYVNINKKKYRIDHPVGMPRFSRRF